MRELRRLVRALLLGLHLLLGAVLACGVLAAPPSLRVRVPRLAAWWLRRGAAILGVRALARGRPADRPALMVANHISWLDILVIATHSECGYVAKAEVSGWPLLGWLAQVGGTEFIARGSHKDLKRVLARLVRRLNDGESLSLFPEGTSTRSALPQRFRSRLLQAAVEAKVPVQPIAIHYGAHLPRAAFAGDDDFVSNLWALLGGDPVRVEVMFLPPLSSVGGDCRLLADESWRAVTHVLTRLELSARDEEAAAGYAAAEPLRAT